jgi:hypothetical protein
MLSSQVPLLAQYHLSTCCVLVQRESVIAVSEQTCRHSILPHHHLDVLAQWTAKNATKEAVTRVLSQVPNVDI